ncbi:hypothetical protein Pint_26217 [Pistacia integerrima]|uniref:Uncharacterized protein n=1 Tax=Pistacia integerrima TaxID=434235 RepID=A0ACC0YHR3_9ROSI|nr:hypothetical protein Pint_26217 [Pistacia integerrima]
MDFFYFCTSGFEVIPRAQLDAERAHKLAYGRNNSSSKSRHKKDGKIYVDKETGRKKGDALVTYLKEPSVALAIHFGWSSFSSRWKDPYAITQAKFEQKGDNFVSKQVDNRKKKKLKFEEKMFGWVALMMQRIGSRCSRGMCRAWSNGPVKVSENLMNTTSKTTTHTTTKDEDFNIE